MDLDLLFLKIFQFLLLIHIRVVRTSLSRSDQANQSHLAEDRKLNEVKFHNFHNSSYNYTPHDTLVPRHRLQNLRLTGGETYNQQSPYDSGNSRMRRRGILHSASTTMFSNSLAGPGLAAMFTPPPSFQNNDVSPSFAETTETNVTVIRGRMAELKCAVQNLGTKSISWVRHEDIHVLTVGRITFTNDARFVAHNNPGSNVWVLRIKYPQPRDSGLYECQVSVRPPLARVVQLNVVEPQAVIPPGRELYVDRGSPLNITCEIPDSPEPPRNVFWYHQDKMVTFDGSREGVSVTTIKGPVTTSLLWIQDVKLQDSGVYICSPEGMKEASVTLTVLHGELPQAMQTGSTCRVCFGSHVLLIVVMIYLVGFPYIIVPFFDTITKTQIHDNISSSFSSKVKKFREKYAISSDQSDKIKVMEQHSCWRRSHLKISIHKKTELGTNSDTCKQGFNTDEEIKKSLSICRVGMIVFDR